MCMDWGGAILRGSEEFTGLSSPVTPTVHGSLLLTAPPPIRVLHWEWAVSDQGAGFWGGKTSL